MERKKLVIVIPCYNEEAVLPETFHRLSIIGTSLEQSLNMSYTLLLVDDGSKDLTWKLIEQHSQTDEHVAGIKLAHNVGHQNALWAGLEEADGHCDAAVSIDADLQDDENSIIEMAQLFREGKDVIYGVRKERKTDTFFKRQTAQLFYKMMRIAGSDLVYNHADFRLLSAPALHALVSFPERNLFIRGIVRLLGFQEGYVYYDRNSRQAGESKYPFHKMLNFAIDGITSFSVKPLQFITLLGLIFVFISVGIIIYAIYEHAIGNTMPGWTSLLVSMWFIGGSLLTAIGVIGSYIGKIYQEVKRRPRYFVEKRANL